MKNLIFYITTITIITTIKLYAQNGLYIGMSEKEFNKKLPNILPNEMIYNKELYLQERLYTIDGKWSFQFHKNKLISADFNGDINIKSEKDFNQLIESADSIIKDYIKVYGEPEKYSKGSNNYINRDSYEYKKSIDKKELFFGATWKTKTTNIEISCDYRSNYFNEFQNGIINGPPEWFYHSFKIKYSPNAKTESNNGEKIGKIYIGMDIDSFAKVFPSLFQENIGLTGQWSRKDEIYELKGDWSYRFENGKLTWIHFATYIDDVNENSFNKSLSSTNKIITNYIKQYGKPDEVIVGKTKFIDPFKEKHWGYGVKEVRWKNVNGMKIKIEFSFMGVKGYYYFIVVINHFDKDYPFYD
ncbi:hypothetical protein JXR93_03855 [bacterium]|nr:hypothetical protein [bacterium]